MAIAFSFWHKECSPNLVCLREAWSASKPTKEFGSFSSATSTQRASVHRSLSDETGYQETLTKQHHSLKVNRSTSST